MNSHRRLTASVLLLLSNSSLLNAYPSHTTIKNTSLQDIDLHVISDGHGLQTFTLRAQTEKMYDTWHLKQINKLSNGVFSEKAASFNPQDSGSWVITYDGIDVNPISYEIEQPIHYNPAKTIPPVKQH